MATKASEKDSDDGLVDNQSLYDHLKNHVVYDLNCTPVSQFIGVVC